MQYFKEYFEQIGSIMILTSKNYGTFIVNFKIKNHKKSFYHFWKKYTKKIK